MIRSYLTWGFLLAIVAGPAPGAFLENDFPGQGRPQPRPPALPPVPPVPENEVRTLIHNLTVGRPYHFRGLSVFPLYPIRSLDRRDYTTLDEALGAGLLGVFETGTVNQLRVRNRSGQPVFLLAGEMIVGGKQNRMLRQDVLVPPGADILVPVYCVEKGRWSGRGLNFSSPGCLSTPALRTLAGRQSAQDRIWKEAAEQADRLSVRSTTGNFVEVFQSKRLEGELAQFDRVLGPLWRRAVAGVVICRYGQISGAELFSQAKLFSRLRRKIVNSYVVHRLLAPGRPRFVPPDIESVRAFLERAADSRLSYGFTPGEGRGLRLSGPVHGSGLSARGVAVHLHLNETVYIIEKE